MSQSDQKQDESALWTDKPFLGFRSLSTEDYRIDKLYDHQRWMCPNCGLIFDYKFYYEEQQPGWPALDYDHLIEVDDYGDQYHP